MSNRGATVVAVIGTVLLSYGLSGCGQSQLGQPSGGSTGVTSPATAASRTGTEATSSGSTSSTVAISGSAAAGDCPALDQNIGLPIAAPPSTWDVVEAIALPKTPAGPAVTQRLERRCYAHTPAGALAAGANLALLMNTRAGCEQVLTHQTTAGPERDRLVNMTVNDPTKANSSLRLMGYAIRTASADKAVIEYVMAYKSSLLAGPLALTWDQGDWKIDGNAPGPDTGHAITSMDGYTPWRNPAGGTQDR